MAFESVQVENNAVVEPTTSSSSAQFTAFKVPTIDAPQILCKLNRTKFTGKIVFQKDHFQNELFLQKGTPVFAKTNNKTLKVGRIFINRGWISEEQLVDALVVADHEDSRVGEALLELGIIQPHQLLEVIQDQIKQIIFSVFFWESGQYTLQSSLESIKEKIVLNDSCAQLIYEGVKRACDDERILMTFKGPETVLQPIPDFPKFLEPLRLDGKCRKTANFIDGLRSVEEIIQMSDLPRDEVLQLLYALFCLKICQI